MSLFVLVSNLIVEIISLKLTFNNKQEIAFNRVGLVLGTSKFLASNKINPYYEYRIKAAHQLFKEGKIEFLLLSGDNGRASYDEPTTMKEDLVRLGVPSSKIYLDYAGFRKLDSIVRAKEIFGQSNLTVISLEFHNERAICIGKLKGMNVIGYNAKDVPTQHGLKVQVREVLARLKMIIDLIVGLPPKYLGDKIRIE